jgi:N-acetylglucosamine-6-sulfatase
VNQYDNPDYAKVVLDLKARLAKLRDRIGDDGKAYPAAEAVVDEFWDYDEADRAKAVKISGEYLKLKSAGDK